MFPGEMNCFICCAFWFAIVVIVLKLWFKLTTGWCRSNVCLIGKTVIITGGNSGIGYETAADFAKRGAKVILACRDHYRGENAKEKIIMETDNKNILFKKLDLSSFKSVRKFAEDINKSEERLDILVNNAGVGISGPKKSKDGLLMIMQVNYLGPFLLTNLLLDILKRTPGSRVVNVSSHFAKYTGFFDVNNLNQSVSNGFEELKAYSRSKLCKILFTIELAARLKGTTVTVYSLNPGAVLTNILNSLPALMKYALDILLNVFFKNAQEGAQTTIYCSVEKDIEPLSGHHFSDCRVMKNYQIAQQSDLPRQLWDVSEKAVNLNQNLN